MTIGKIWKPNDIALYREEQRAMAAGFWGYRLGLCAVFVYGSHQLMGYGTLSMGYAEEIHLSNEGRRQLGGFCEVVNVGNKTVNIWCRDDQIETVVGIMKDELYSATAKVDGA